MQYPCVLLMCSFILISGCATRNTDRPDPAKINANVEKNLTNVARSIEHSLSTLALTHETHYPPLLNTAPLVTPEGGMGGTADIDWTGPIEPLLQKIAKMSDYKLKTLGSEPAIPIVVSVTQRNVVIADILKNASLQAGKRANIMVFPANRVIELRYRTG